MIAINWNNNSATSTTPRGGDVVWYSTSDIDPVVPKDSFSDASRERLAVRLRFLAKIGARIAFKRWKPTGLFFLTLLYWPVHYRHKLYIQPCVNPKRQNLSGVCPRNRGRHFDRKLKSK